MGKKHSKEETYSCQCFQSDDICHDTLLCSFQITRLISIKCIFKKELLNIFFKNKIVNKIFHKKTKINEYQYQFLINHPNQISLVGSKIANPT